MMLPIGVKVRVFRDPYDEPLPVDGTITGVRVSEKSRYYADDRYNIVFTLRMVNGHVREFDFAEVVLEVDQS